MSSYQCTVCENVFSDSDLEDATEIGGGRGRSRRPIFVFADGSVHYLRKIKEKKPQSSTPEPKKEDTELLQAVADVLIALPTSVTPEPESEPEPLPMVEPEIEKENLTAMEFAFRRVQGKL